MFELWLFKTAECHPCVAYQPQVEALARRRSVPLRVIYADDPANDARTSLCEVYTVPSVVIVKDGAPVYMVTGANLKALEWACTAEMGW
jgi:thioredoxin-like negative regulator of GroEL